MIDLFCRTLGTGREIILLHGLFGSGDNLGTLARGLSKHYKVFSFDLRDHGRSPHSDGISYQAMAADVLAQMDSLRIPTASIFGHSMGGKVAMQLAALAPDRINRLIIGDIAPVDYGRNHDAVLDAQLIVQKSVHKIDTRDQAIDLMKPYIVEDGVLPFLMTNFRRGVKGWGWRHNLDVIVRDYDEIAKAPTFGKKPFGRPVLFIKGERSDYILPEMENAIGDHFMRPYFKMIGRTGHWFHAEKPEITLRLVTEFLESDV